MSPSKKKKSSGEIPTLNNYKYKIKIMKMISFLNLNLHRMILIRIGISMLPIGLMINLKIISILSSLNPKQK